MHSWFESIVVGLLFGIFMRPILEDQAKRQAEKLRQDREDAQAMRDFERELKRSEEQREKWIASVIAGNPKFREMEPAAAREAMLEQEREAWKICSREALDADTIGN